MAEIMLAPIKSIVVQNNQIAAAIISLHELQLLSRLHGDFDNRTLVLQPDPLNAAPTCTPSAAAQANTGVGISVNNTAQAAWIIEASSVIFLRIVRSVTPAERSLSENIYAQHT